MMSKDFVVGIGLGAAIAYMGDPQTGQHRRALAKDQVMRAGRRTRRALDASGRDLVTRAAGFITRTSRETDSSMNDARLVERVRARVRQSCSHPRAIGVEALNGVVTLSGPILADEAAAVLGAVWHVPGLQMIRNELAVFHSSRGATGLQRAAAPHSMPRLLRRFASSPKRLLAAGGLGATALMVAAYARR
jgi:hypothetical protein